MDQWLSEKIDEQTSLICKLIVEPVEPKNDVQRCAAKIRSILGNFISFLCFLLVLILGFMFIIQEVFPGFLSWFLGIEMYYKLRIWLVLSVLLVMSISLRWLLTVAQVLKSYYIGSLIGFIFFTVVVTHISNDIISGKMPSAIFQEYITEFLKKGLGS
jgi:hypothetical protein